MFESGRQGLSIRLVTEKAARLFLCSGFPGALAPLPWSFRGADLPRRSPWGVEPAGE